MHMIVKEFELFVLSLIFFVREVERSLVHAIFLFSYFVKDIDHLHAQRDTGFGVALLWMMFVSFSPIMGWITDALRKPVQTLIAICLIKTCGIYIYAFVEAKGMA